MKKVVLSLVALVAVSLIAMPAMADTAYNNLGNPPSYNCCSGWTVGGSSSPVGLVEDAEQFTSMATGSVNQIDVAVGWVLGTNSITVQLWTSVGDLPGTMLGSGTVGNLPVFGTCCAVDTVTGNLGSVVAGQQYFVVVLAANDEWAAWNLSNSDVGLLLQNSGSGWNQFFGEQEGGYDVLTGGVGTPEPGTFVMLGSGVLALAGAFRRKINL